MVSEKREASSGEKNEAEAGDVGLFRIRVCQRGVSSVQVA